MKRLFCLIVKNGLGRFALSALPHHQQLQRILCCFLLCVFRRYRLQTVVRCTYICPAFFLLVRIPVGGVASVMVRILYELYNNCIEIWIRY